MNRFNHKRVTNLTDKQFKKLETMFDNANKIDLIMYLHKCGFDKSINDVLKHIEEELSDGIKYKSKFLS